MSQENVEVVRRAIRDFGETGGFASDCYDDAIVFVTRGDGPTQSTFHGVAGLRGAMKSFGEVWASISFEAQEFIEADEAVVVPLLFHLRANSGVQLDVHEAWAYWVRDGAIQRIEQHGTRRDALEAVGLSE
jgi:ketosteroid isomerase-like protein